MGWVNRLLPTIVPESAESRQNSGLAQPADWLTDAMAATPAASGQTVTVLKAMGLAPVWAACSFISEQIGALPLNVYRTVDYDKGYVEEARSHRSYRMLHDKPNPIQDAGRFWSIVSLHILLWGNAFIYKERDIFGMVESLWLLHPSTTVVYWNPITRVKHYQHTPKDMSSSPIMFSDNDVIHIMGMSQDGLVGESVIGRARNAFGAALARDEFEGGFYQRGAVLLAVVEAPTALSETAARNVKETINLTYGGSGKAFQIGVLEENAKLHELGMPMKDMEFVASQQLTRTDVAVMFKLPPDYLGGSSGGSLHYTTVEQNQLHFGLHAVSPLTDTIARCLSQDPALMPQKVFYAKFVLDEMFRADMQTRYNAYDKALGKWMSKNEIRSKENLAPVEGGDKIESPAPPTPQPAVNGTGPHPALPSPSQENA